MTRLWLSCWRDTRPAAWQRSVSWLQRRYTASGRGHASHAAASSPHEPSECTWAASAGEWRWTVLSQRLYSQGVVLTDLNRSCRSNKTTVVVVYGTVTRTRHPQQQQHAEQQRLMQGQSRLIRGTDRLAWKISLRESCPRRLRLLFGSRRYRPFSARPLRAACGGGDAGWYLAVFRGILRILRVTCRIHHPFSALVR